MSVDTYLAGKNTTDYERHTVDDVAVLVSPVLARWSQRVQLSSRTTLFGRRLAVDVEHEHGPACRH